MDTNNEPKPAKTMKTATLSYSFDGDTTTWTLETDGQLNCFWSREEAIRFARERSIPISNPGGPNLLADVAMSIDAAATIMAYPCLVSAMNATREIIDRRIAEGKFSPRRSAILDEIHRLYLEEDPDIVRISARNLLS